MLLLGAGPAQAATPRLPDLRQEVPTQVSLSGGSGGGQITFQSEVTNVGSGPIEVHGHRPNTSQANMTADQIVHMSDGSTTTIPGIGDLHFETGFGHHHWHFEPFDHYELRKLDGTLIGTDVKQGFCLGDNTRGNGSPVFTDFCKQDQPNALDLTEGISASFGDAYDPGKEGQSIPITQSAVPTGDYWLLHRVNENSDGSHGPVQESSFSNNVAALKIHINWSASGNPSITSQSNACSSSPSCDHQPAPPPQPQPQPQPQPHSTPTPPGPPPSPNDIVAPTLKIAKLQTEHVKSHTSALFVNASCSEQCTITAQGTVSIGGAAKALRTGKVSLTLPANTSTKVLLPLSSRLRKTIRRALAHHRRVLVKVTVKVVDTAGNAASHSYTLKLAR